MKNHTLKIIVVTIIFIISVLLIVYFQQIKIIYYTCKYKMVSNHIAFVNMKQQEIIDKLVAMNIKTDELPQNTEIRYQLIRHYSSELLGFKPSEYKRNVEKYFGKPLVSFNDYSNNEYLIYWEQYFVFDKEGICIKTGITDHMKVR
jgi:hypothetical protein